MMKNYDVYERFAHETREATKHTTTHTHIRRRRKKQQQQKPREMKASVVSRAYTENTSLLYRIETRKYTIRTQTTQKSKQQIDSQSVTQRVSPRIACAFAICVDYLQNMFMHWLKNELMTFWHSLFVCTVLYCSVCGARRYLLRFDLIRWNCCWWPCERLRGLTTVVHTVQYSAEYVRRWY